MIFHFSHAELDAPLRFDDADAARAIIFFHAYFLADFAAFAATTLPLRFRV